VFLVEFEVVEKPKLRHWKTRKVVADLTGFLNCSQFKFNIDPVYVRFIQSSLYL